ncbi:hypothetical protein DPEC_G00166300 [Dallia pectoralis]|uniref:Uncharacterized protein n=1 Tax=Dallia pectoralis TaxID=75939 RepID=A0ACC2GHW5_DALPE|nr:hypothetical protein DPEC_G00166300 [Dallia pectoralis]
MSLLLTRPHHESLSVHLWNRQAHFPVNDEKALWNRRILECRVGTLQFQQLENKAQLTEKSLM